MDKCQCPDCGFCVADHSMCGSWCVCFEDHERDECSCHQDEINIYCRECF